MQVTILHWGCSDYREAGLHGPVTFCVPVTGPNLLGSLNSLEYKHRAVLFLPVTAPGYTVPDLSFLLGSSSLNDVLVWFHNVPATFGYYNSLVPVIKTQSFTFLKLTLQTGFKALLLPSPLALASAGPWPSGVVEGNRGLA